MKNRIVNCTTEKGGCLNWFIRVFSNGKAEKVKVSCIGDCLTEGYNEVNQNTGEEIEVRYSSEIDSYMAISSDSRVIRRCKVGGCFKNGYKEGSAPPAVTDGSGVNTYEERQRLLGAQ